MKEMVKAFQKKGIYTLPEVLDFVRHIPYGRNSSRTDFALVLSENKGTCSTKHALVKTFALEKGLEEVQLIMGIYKMNGQNTPATAAVFADAPLAYIPEAHVYLNIKNEYHDLTTADSDFSILKDDVLLEMEIQPEQVGSYKVDWHRAFLKKWIVEEGLGLGFEEVWGLRERCILALSA